MSDAPRNLHHQGRLMWILWTAFFFQGMALGCWFPSLTNIFGERGLSDWVPIAFMIPPCCALVGPLLTGALADQRFAAEQVYRALSLISAATLAAAFITLDLGWHPVWFMVFIGSHALLSAPTWGLLTTISMNSLTHPERRFPLTRVGGTLGWIAGGLITSFLLQADTRPLAGYAGSITRLATVALAFALPHTPPLGLVHNWRSRLGFDAFQLFKQRDHLVFFVVTGLFSIPISAFYMYGPEFLMVLGDKRPTGTMTIAQVLEIGCLIVLGSLLARYRVKVVLLWALGLSVLRFAMSAQAGMDGHILWHISGLALHGVCYTLYFVTSQIFIDRRVDPGLRSQAQGLLMVVAAGVGPLVGSWFCGMLRANVVHDGSEGWVTFWAILSGMIAVCTLIFAIFYRGLGKPTRN